MAQNIYKEKIKVRGKKRRHSCSIFNEEIGSFLVRRFLLFYVDLAISFILLMCCRLTFQNAL